MSDRTSRFVADLLAHRSGFWAFNIFTAAWFVVASLIAVAVGAPELAVVVVAATGYLDVVTWFGGATQFTLAYQNRKAEIANELQLRNQMDLMNLVVAIAKENRSRMMEVQDEVEEIVEALDDPSHIHRHGHADVEKEVG